MTRVVLFDLDGTLIDSEGDISAAFLHAAQALRPGIAVDAGRLRPLIGRPLGVMASELGFGLSHAEEQAFEREYRARFDAIDCSHARVFDGVRELLGLLPPRRLGVVTGKIQYQAAHVVARVGLAPLFSHVQGWRLGLMAKPAPDLLHEALDAMGARPEDAAYVGDAPTDIQAAHAAGVEAIAVAWGFGELRALQDARPAHLVTSVGELATLVKERISGTRS